MKIAGIRTELLAEFPIYALRDDGSEIVVTADIADTLTFSNDHGSVMVIDWKSDVNPNAQTLEQYRAQVRVYLDMTGAERGLIVLMTRGTAIAVSPSPRSVAEQLPP